MYYYSEELTNKYSDELSSNKRQHKPKVVPITDVTKPNPLPEKYTHMTLLYNLELDNFAKIDVEILFQR